MTPNSPRVLLAIGGGIAAYKTPELVRALLAANIDVQVIATEAALTFVSELSLATVSKKPVRSTLLDVAEEGHIGHIELADWPDIVVVAPATADLLARAAAGMANDLVSCCLLATKAPILWAPAMNTNMWNHPATQANLARLHERGGHFVGPDRGSLACGWVGEGRMIDPARIVEAVQAQLATKVGKQAQSWQNRRVLISAGPTRTYIDPVRFLTNGSTGAMGFALAEAVRQAGAEISLVAGPVQLSSPAGVQRIDVETTPQMYEAMDSQLASKHYDAVLMVAAVNDFDVDGSQQKLAKDVLLQSMAQLKWHTAKDILATLAARYRPASKFLGFAAQTLQPGQDSQMLIELGRKKLREKNVDALFVNQVGIQGHGFASATNAGHLIIRGENKQETIYSMETPISKSELAVWISQHLAKVWWGT